MFIKRNTYEKLLNRSKLVDELEDETKRLAALITAKTKDCKMGMWCKDCIHFGCDSAEVSRNIFWSGDYSEVIGGQVYYCKKHFHELCPDFEQK